MDGSRQMKTRGSIMKKTLTGLAIGGLLTLSTGAALADGLPDYRGRSMKDVSAPCCSTNWDGIYVGAAVGVGAVITDARDPDGVFFNQGASVSGLGGDGIFGAITVGMDRKIHDGIVLGVFGEYEFGDRTVDINDGNGNNISFSKKDAWSVGARLGFVRNCCTMWYVNGGYTNAKFDLGVPASISASNKIDFDDRLDGWFVGGGVETALRDGWFLKLEYRYADYGSNDVTVSNSDFTSKLSLEPVEHSVRLGIVYKFDMHRDRMVEPMK